MNLPKLEKRARQRQKLMRSSSSYLPDLVGKMNTASDNHSTRLTISAAAKESSDLTGWSGAIIYTPWNGVKFSSKVGKRQELGDR